MSRKIQPQKSALGPSKPSHCASALKLLEYQRLRPVVLPPGQEVRRFHPGYEDVSFEITGYDLDAAPEPDRGEDDWDFRLWGVGFYLFIEEGYHADRTGF